MKGDAAGPELEGLDPEALLWVAEALPRGAPSAGARARLFEALEGPDRFRPFFAELARRFDLGVEALRGLLARVDDPAAWEGTPIPWIQLIHFQAGPAVVAKDTGFVRVGAGTTFPRHRHLGPETTFVLEGRMTEGDREYGPGDILEVREGDVHELVIRPERDVVAMVAHDGIALLGAKR
jgi:hypothetical protein